MSPFEPENFFGERSEDGGELFKKGRLRRGLDDKAQLTFQPVSLYRHETTINNRLWAMTRLKQGLSKAIIFKYDKRLICARSRFGTANLS